MRILLFFRGKGGGVGRVMPRIASELSQLGHEVFVVSGRRDADSPNLLQGSVAPERIVELGTTRLRRMVAPLRALIQRIRPAGIICGAHLPSFVGAIAVSGLKWRPLLITSIRTDLDAIFRPFGPTGAWALRQSLKWTFMRSSAIVCVSQGVKNQLTSQFPKLLQGKRSPKVIYPATLAAEPATLRKTWGQKVNSDANEPELSLLWVGRLSEQKDPCAAIECVRELRKIRPDVHLTMVGDGPLKQACEDQVRQYGLSKYVHLAGQIDNPYPYYQRSHVFLQTSQWGGLDNTLVEAMAFGLKIVCTDYPTGPREVLNGEKFGCLVPVGDQYAMASACIEASIEGVTSPRELAERDSHLTRFTSRFVAEQYEALLSI